MRLSTSSTGILGILALVVAVLFSSLPADGADDVAALFQLGKAAYYRGELELANQLLAQVAARDPRHFETRALLAQIRTSLKSTGDMSLKKRYEGVNLNKVELTEVTFSEALEGLRALSKGATEGKVVPNFIVQDATLGSKVVSLTLTSIPLSEAIQYLAKVANCRVIYEKHAVIFTSAAGGDSVAPPAGG